MFIDDIYISEFTLSIRSAYINEIQAMETDVYNNNHELIYVEKEPDEIRQFIPKIYEHNRHCHRDFIPLCLQYKIQQGIGDVAELAEYCDVGRILEGGIVCPQIVRKTQTSQFQITATFCVRCGDYLKGANRSFRFPTRKVAFSAQCACDYKYYTEYLCDVFRLLYYVKSNITVENSGDDIMDTIMGLRRNIQMYNLWATVSATVSANISSECPYVYSNTDLANINNNRYCYSESDSDNDLFECDSDSSVVSLFGIGIGDSGIIDIISYISSEDE